MPVLRYNKFFVSSCQMFAYCHSLLFKNYLIIFLSKLILSCSTFLRHMPPFFIKLSKFSDTSERALTDKYYSIGKPFIPTILTNLYFWFNERSSSGVESTIVLAFLCNETPTPPRSKVIKGALSRDF